MQDCSDQQVKENKQKVERKKDEEKRLAFPFTDRMSAGQININHLVSSAKRPWTACFCMTEERTDSN